MSTYHNVLFHIIFSTKDRQALIVDEIQSRLFEYIGGTIRSEGGTCYQVGGIEDHVHLLVRWRCDASVADLVRIIKSKSSLWVHRTFSDQSYFAWQRGYACFSVSQSQCENVKEYILNQRQHHRKRTFQQELIGLLNLNEVNYDPQYLWA